MAKLRKRGKVFYSDLRIHGKRIVKALSSDKEIAENRLADLIKRRDAVKYGHGQRDSAWADFKPRYLEHSKDNKPKTFHNDRDAIKAIEEYRAFTRLAQLGPEFLEGFKAHRKKGGYSPATINRNLGAIKAMLRKAVEWGYMEALPWKSVKPFKTTRGRVYFYSMAQLRTLLGACRGQYKTVCLLAARAGLRCAEIYWLSWEDVDLNRKILSITPKDGWEPKDYQMRHIPLSKDLLGHLRALPRANKWVLGVRPRSPGSLSFGMFKLTRSLGLEGTLHILRHTFASHLAMAGVSLYAISKLLGHSNTAMAEIYSHLQPSTLRDAIDRLPEK